ncbi:hypothetical protein OG216_30555 [Streptomycetaceae bacterium NBC_01309]
MDREDRVGRDKADRADRADGVSVPVPAEAGAGTSAGATPTGPAAPSTAAQERAALVSRVAAEIAAQDRELLDRLA